MTIKPLKTKKIIAGDDILNIFDEFVPEIRDGSVLAVTSKIIAICQGRIKEAKDFSKIDLIKEESDFYIDPTQAKYNLIITIKNNFLAASAGIDESNGNGYFVLWPEHLQETANEIRQYFVKKYNLKKFGVIITDSKTTPLKRGTTGYALAHSGFYALKNYINQPDIFGREMHVTKANIMDGLAAASVLIMGEGDEQTPMALITDLDFVNFSK